MITPINQTTTNYYNHKPCRVNFQGYNPAQFAAPAERSLRNIEFAGRKIINIFFDFFNKNKHSELYEQFLNADPKSEDYIHILTKISQIFSNQKPVEINIEGERIERIARTKSPHIFIMNHDNQSKDPKMLAFFNTLLNHAYIREGIEKTCPRPRIILNQDILLSMSKLNRAIFEKLGAVGIDASLYGSDSQANARTFFKLIREFLNKEINIFIFPEGKNAIRKNVPLCEKFQLGVAELVARIADRKPEVNITPLGFAYGKKSDADSIYIGETVVLKKLGEHIESSRGNISSPFAKAEYKDFFAGRNSAVLTDKSIPVEGRELPQYIGGILCENLRICKEEAITAIK